MTALPPIWRIYAYKRGELRLTYETASHPFEAACRHYSHHPRQKIFSMRREIGT